MIAITQNQHDIWLANIKEYEELIVNHSEYKDVFQGKKEILEELISQAKIIKEINNWDSITTDKNLSIFYKKEFPNGVLIKNNEI